MRLFVSVLMVALILTGLGWAEEGAPAEPPAPAEEEAWPPGPAAEEYPEYIGAPAGEPLRPLRKVAPPKLVAPPLTQPDTAAPVGPPPPVVPQIPAPRFDPAAAPALSLAFPAPGGGIDEGKATLVWNTAGPIAYVRLSYSGDNCRLGGRARGSFSRSIAKVGNKGTYQWQVPWMDAPEFALHLVGYGADGKQLAATQATYQLRPRLVQDKPGTCIVVSKSRQRLWYLSDGLIKRMHVISTAASGYYTPSMRPGSYDHSRGAMGRVFSKAFAPMSHMYHVVMYYWLQITSSGSHGIHATSPPFYGRLGGPASHGCIRQHRADARVLYDLVSVGTPVYVQ